MKETLHKILNPLYLLLWLAISLYLGMYHEPWADEAQGYLIARDVPISELISSISRTEGSPVLWFLWLKFLLFLGVSYNQLYLASIIPEFLGVALFVYKAPFRKMLRFLFPLTYYLFYQYNIIARSYSFILLFMSLLAVFYKKRDNYPLKYTFLLMLFGEITLHTLLLSGLMFAEWQYKNYKKSKKNILLVFLFTLYTILNIWMLYPDMENQYVETYYQSAQFIVTNIWCIISQPLVTSAEFFTSGNETFNALNIVFFGLMTAELYEKFQREFLMLILPSLGLMIFIPFKPWHSGFLIILVMYLFWIKSGNVSFSLFGKMLLSILFAVQLFWSGVSFYRDKTELYAVGKEAVNFLARYKIGIRDTMRINYHTTTFCPYLNSKLCSYWDWQKEGFNKNPSANDFQTYRAFIINQATYEVAKDFFNTKAKEWNLSLKIIPADTFFALRECSQSETLYIYYKGESGE